MFLPNRVVLNGSPARGVRYSEASSVGAGLLPAPLSLPAPLADPLEINHRAAARIGIAQRKAADPQTASNDNGL
ncbi:hypothetical protein GSbR_08980 [Geobacter sp. SVR]|nr:hypothetical protein GSVR_12220 [Geobacter sp. SVR]GCF84298.1 hypothetical protein GSbR_08980 [Geobacter sp. SVR]